MQNWDIKLIEDRSIETDGSTYLVYNDYMATIKINEKLSKEEKEKSLIYEVIHIVLRDTQTIADDNIKQEDVNKIYNRNMERETEKLAEGIYKILNEEIK